MRPFITAPTYKSPFGTHTPTLRDTFPLFFITYYITFSSQVYPDWTVQDHKATHEKKRTMPRSGTAVYVRGGVVASGRTMVLDRKAFYWDILVKEPRYPFGETVAPEPGSRVMRVKCFQNRLFCTLFLLFIFVLCFLFSSVLFSFPSPSPVSSLLLLTFWFWSLACVFC